MDLQFYRVLSLKDYHRKRHREDERHRDDERHRPVDMPKRNENEQHRNADHESRPVSIVFPLKLLVYKFFQWLDHLRD